MCFFCILGYIVQKKSAQKNTLNGSVITIWRDFGKKCNILIWCQPYLLASFILLIVHIARYIPSLNEEKISRNMRLKSYQVIFFAVTKHPQCSSDTHFLHPRNRQSGQMPVVRNGMLRYCVALFCRKPIWICVKILCMSEFISKFANQNKT